MWYPLLMQARLYDVELWFNSAPQKAFGLVGSFMRVYDGMSNIVYSINSWAL